MTESHDYISKTIIIGITRLDCNDQLIEQIQMHGVITKVTPSGIEIELSTGELYSLPPDLDSIHGAPPGTYKFRSTGEEVVNPDFMTTWTVRAPEEPV